MRQHGLSHPADEQPGNAALHDMRAQLAALHTSMWGRGGRN